MYPFSYALQQMADVKKKLIKGGGNKGRYQF